MTVLDGFRYAFNPVIIRRIWEGHLDISDFRAGIARCGVSL